MYTLAMAKNDFKEGWLDGFTLVKVGQEWLLEVWKYDQNGISRTISAARGEIRKFKSIEGAVKTAEQIGFSVHALKFEKI